MKWLIKKCSALAVSFSLLLTTTAVAGDHVLLTPDAKSMKVMEVFVKEYNQARTSRAKMIALLTSKSSNDKKAIEADLKDASLEDFGKMKYENGEITLLTSKGNMTMKVISYGIDTLVMNINGQQVKFDAKDSYEVKMQKLESIKIGKMNFSELFMSSAHADATSAVIKVIGVALATIIAIYLIAPAALIAVIFLGGLGLTISTELSSDKVQKAAKACQLDLDQFNAGEIRQLRKEEVNLSDLIKDIEQDCNLSTPKRGAEFCLAYTNTVECVKRNYNGKETEMNDSKRSSDKKINSSDSPSEKNDQKRSGTVKR